MGAVAGAELGAAPERPAAPAEPLRAEIPEPSGWWYRAGAAMIDYGTGYLLLLGVGAILGLTGHVDDHTIEVASVATLLGWWLFSLVVIAGLRDGRSVGKLIAGIRVARDNGKPYGIGIAFVREVLCRAIWLIPLVALLDVLFPLGYEHQSIRDRMAGTRVWREPSYRRRRWRLAIAATVVSAVVVAAVAMDDDSSSATADQYTAADRAAYVQGCMKRADATRPQCGCEFDVISARLSYQEFVQAGRQRSSEWPPRIRRVLGDAFRGCTRRTADLDPA